MAKLTGKEDKLVEGIALGKGNKEAGLDAGYSPNCVDVIVAETLSKPRIQQALEERKAYYRSIADVEAKDVIGAHQEMAFASIEDALDDDGFLDFKKAKANGAAKLIKKISRQQTKYGETVSVEFYSRTDALNQLTDILGLKKMPASQAESQWKDAVKMLLADPDSQVNTVKEALHALRQVQFAGLPTETELDDKVLDATELTV